jgi:hypothetical protein
VRRGGLRGVAAGKVQGQKHLEQVSLGEEEVVFALEASCWCAGPSAPEGGWPAAQYGPA